MSGTPGAGGPPDRATLAAFLGVVVLGGANAVAVKLTVAELDPFWGAGLRFVLAAALMLAIVGVTRRSLPRGQSLWGAVLYGVVGFAASYALAYVGLRDVPAGTAMVFIALTPLFTFGLAIVQRQESFRLQGLAGAVIAAVGVAVVFVDQLTAAVPPLSLVLILLAAVAIAESGVIVKWIPRSDPFATNGIAMLTGAALLLALSLVASESLAVPADSATWLAVGYLVVLGSVVMFALYVFALQRWTASAVSYVTLLMPVVTVALAAVLIGDRITVPFLAGSAIVLAGVYVGAFLPGVPRRLTATSAPECLPVADCPDAADAPATAKAARA